jgi:hypothetical protein
MPASQAGRRGFDPRRPLQLPQILSLRPKARLQPRVSSRANTSHSTTSAESSPDGPPIQTRLRLVAQTAGSIGAAALTVVTPQTFIGWRRKGFQLFGRRKCQSGRPRIAPDLLRLIRKMARENPSWGDERIANGLLLKLGVRVSSRRIRKYLPKLPFAPADSLAAISVGQPFSRITMMPSSPLTSTSQRAPLF